MAGRPEQPVCLNGTRKTFETVRHALAQQATVAFLGPRRVGKTTLALQLGEAQHALYLDLEEVQDRDKLDNAAVFLWAYEDWLVILDEIHRVPDLFLTLRGLIDQGPRRGARVPAETLRRFWNMLAHNQGGLVSASRLAAGLEVSSQTVSRYTDLLVDLLLVRRLQAYHVNVGKRLVKAPKVYIRDSGLLHALFGHPVVGASWDGFVIENLINAAPALVVPGFYRTAGGAEVDLLLELPGGERWAIEIKRSRAAKPARGFHEACADLKPARRFVVHAGTDRFALSDAVEAIGVLELANWLSNLAV